MAMVLVAARVIVLGQFRNLEEQDGQRNVERALDALATQQTSINSQCADWAHWDDPYAFMESHDPQFVQSNVTVQALADLRIDLMLFVDSSGHILVGRGYDLYKQQEAPVSKSWQARFTGGKDRLLQHPDLESSVAGIVMLPEGPVWLFHALS